MLLSVTKTKEGWRIENTDDGKEGLRASVQDLAWIAGNLKNKEFSKAYESWIKSNKRYMKCVV